MRGLVFVFMLIFCINITTATTAGESRNEWPDYQYYPELQGWLKLHTEPTDYQDARIQCHMEDALIASEWNPEFTKAMVGLTDNLSSVDQTAPALYSGAQLSFSDGVYSYVKGEPVLKLGKSMELERCLVLFSNGTSGEVDCQKRLPYVCFAPVPACGDKESSGYQFESSTGHCYKYVSTALNWTNAYQACRKDGAYLAVVNSDAEAQFFRTLMPSDATYVIIGYYYWVPTKLWWTVKGQTIQDAGFSTWRSGEPTGGAHRGFFHRDGELFSYYQGTTASYICEKDPVLLTLNS